MTDGLNPTKSILLIDDDEDFAESISDILQIHEYHVHVVNNIDDSFRILRDHAPDIALIDLHLGDENGFSFIDEIKSHYPDMLFLVITAHAAIDSALEALKTGAYDYLRKPIGTNDLLSAVDRAFETLNLMRKNKAVEEALFEHNKQLETLNSRLRSIVESANIFNSVNDYEYLVDILLKEFLKRLNAQKGQVIINAAEKSIPIRSGTHHTDTAEFSFDDPLITEALQNKYTLIRDMTEDLKIESTIPSLFPSGSVLILPFIGPHQELLGLVIVNTERPGGFTGYDVDIGLIMSSLAVNTIQNIEVLAELARQEAAIQQGKKMEAMGRLAGGIAHDFNNILAGISGYIELLKMDLLEEEYPEQTKYLGEMKKSVNYGSGLTQQLLTFSRRQQVNSEDFLVNDLIHELDHMVKLLLGDEIIVHMDLCGEPASICINKSQFKRIVINVAMNAKDAMPNGGVFTLSTSIGCINDRYIDVRPENLLVRYVIITMKDTGVGIPKEVLQHVFEPFFTTKNEGKGTGLGLSTVFGIVRQSGGFVKVNSKTETDTGGATGTSISIALPLVETEQFEHTEPQTKDIVDTKKLKVLLVEDDDRLTDSISRLLKRRNFTVYSVSNGEEALTLGKEVLTAIDILITDVMMPKMSGDVLAEKLIAMREGLPVLYISGYSDEALYNNKSLEFSAENFLQKPFTADELFSKITSLTQKVNC